jgi:hypothetical protein
MVRFAGAFAAVASTSAPTAPINHALLPIKRAEKSDARKQLKTDRQARHEAGKIKPEIFIVENIAGTIDLLKLARNSQPR